MSRKIALAYGFRQELHPATEAAPLVSVRRDDPGGGTTSLWHAPWHAQRRSPTVRIGQYEVDPANRVVRGSDGGEVRLTPTEWHILEILARNPGKLVSQRQLLQEVWGPTYESETNHLRQYMAQLRRKLEDDPARPYHLLTEPGMGYRLRPAGVV